LLQRIKRLPFFAIAVPHWKRAVYHDCGHVTNADAVGGFEQQPATNPMRFVSMPESKWDEERKTSNGSACALGNSGGSPVSMTKI
jgi:hypothetical protein